MSEKTEKKPSKVIGFFRSVKGELSKIVWPSKKDVIKNTGVVIAFMLIIAIIVFGIDKGFEALFGFVTGLFTK